MNDLKALLCKGSIAEQKSFLRSSIKRFEVNLPQIIIDYTIPLQKKKAEPLPREVLPFEYFGSPSRTRTYNLVVNPAYGGTLPVEHPQETA